MASMSLEAAKHNGFGLKNRRHIMEKPKPCEICGKPVTVKRIKNGYLVICYRCDEGMTAVGCTKTRAIELWNH